MNPETHRGLVAGDRVRLLEMPDDPHPLPAGSEGTVMGFFVGLGIEQIQVNWDDGSNLNLAEIDRWEQISAQERIV